MKRISILFLVVVIGLSLVFFAFAENTITEFSLDGEAIITTEDINLMHEVMNANAGLTDNDKLSKSDVREVLVTRALVEPLFEVYDIALPADLEQELLSACQTFEDVYAQAVEEGKEHQYAESRELMDRMIAASGLSKEAYYAWATDYSIYQYKLMFLKEHFNQDPAALENAIIDYWESQGETVTVPSFNLK